MTEIRTWEEYVNAVWKMRELQKTYFAHGDRTALFEAKKIEIIVDAATRKKQRDLAEKKQTKLQTGGN